MIYIGYVLTILSIILYAIGLQFKKKVHIILSQIICKLLTAISLFCFYSMSGVWLSIMSLGVLFISYLKESTNKDYKIFYFIFQLIYISILIITFDGISSILVFIGSSLSLFSLFWLREQPLRIVGFVKSIIYLIYQLVIGNWAGLTETIILYSYVSSYIKYKNLNIKTI